MFEKIIEKAESLGWGVTCSGSDICFENWTSAGQNLIFENNFENIEELLKSLKSRVLNFDIKEEANYWINEQGHGTNGAPFLKKDILKDMREAKKMYKELYNAIK
jgi:hypothetical protein